MLAYLIEDADFSRGPLELRGDCSKGGIRIEEQPLRFLDVLIWTKATGP
jgi:hypothetical protein